MTTTPIIVGIDPQNKSCILSEEDRRNYALILNLVHRNYSPIPPPKGDIIAITCILSIILLIGLLSNILVIIWIAKSKPKRSSMDVHIVSLSIADLIAVLTIIPLNTVLLWKDGNWGNMGDESQAKVLCKLGIYFQNISSCISSLSLLVIAIDRYIAICHPLLHYKYSSYKHKVTAVVTVFIWLFSLLIGIMDLVDVRLSASIEEVLNKWQGDERFKNEILFVPDYEYYRETKQVIPANNPDLCRESLYYRTCNEADYRTSNRILLFILSYLLPLVTMIFCYGSIIHKLWLRTPVGDVVLHTSQDKKLKKASTRQTTIMMVILISAFGILWLPFWGSKLHEAYTIIPDEIVEFDYLDESFSILAYVSICSSPIIYMLLDRSLRQFLKQKLSNLGVSAVDALISCLDKDHKNTAPNNQEMSNHPITSHSEKSSSTEPKALKNGVSTEPVPAKVSNA